MPFAGDDDDDAPPTDPTQQKLWEPKHVRSREGIFQLAHSVRQSSFPYNFVSKPCFAQCVTLVAFSTAVSARSLANLPFGKYEISLLSLVAGLSAVASLLVFLAYLFRLPDRVSAARRNRGLVDRALVRRHAAKLCSLIMHVFLKARGDAAGAGLGHAGDAPAQQHVR